MDRDGHRGEVKVIEEHRQMVVKALRGCEIQLQRPAKRNVRQSSDRSRARGPSDSVETAIGTSARSQHVFVDRCLIGVQRTLLKDDTARPRDVYTLEKLCYGTVTLSFGASVQVSFIVSCRWQSVSGTRRESHLRTCATFRRKRTIIASVASQLRRRNLHIRYIRVARY